ncbi:hypothetical protein [Endozoicomonas euniceicola]|uniref:Uncharacterized protein n=1 Tax=Endozoicomonas euniceicola TaxID=1234143 RepID=A0ABY6GZB4_9GAMM|nr:hypothetical protein [Endozoicomonas euniceicola]UYM18143.1 hypothetical protein NX720_09620 [Endozoicomonas euniceicola]
MNRTLAALAAGAVFGLLCLGKAAAQSIESAYVLRSPYDSEWLLVKYTGDDGKTYYCIYTNLADAGSDISRQTLWCAERAKRIKNPNNHNETKAIAVSFYSQQYGYSGESPLSFPNGYPIGQTIELTFLQEVDVSNLNFSE